MAMAAVEAAVVMPAQVTWVAALAAEGAPVQLTAEAMQGYRTWVAAPAL